MAVNESRSMNADLRLGITDGMVKSTDPNRGGPLDAATNDVYTSTEQFGGNSAALAGVAEVAARRITTLHG